MKTRYVFLLLVSAAAALLPGGGHGMEPWQDPSSNRAASRPQSTVGAPSSGMLGILRHGAWQCALPGDAGGEAFLEQPEEAFSIGSASSYETAAGGGIYLMRGTEVVFTRGPKKDQRFRSLGENTLRKLNPDGSLSKLICTRIGGAG
jgi:hypothetical protein